MSDQPPFDIDSVISGSKYGDLVQLSQALGASPRFSFKATDWGLPLAAFVHLECLCWFAQAIRSGVWTYYEATPLERQKLMLSALEKFAPTDFAPHYAQGMRDWEDEDKIDAVDQWIESNDKRAWAWHREHARNHREELLAALRPGETQ